MSNDEEPKKIISELEAISGGPVMDYDPETNSFRAPGDDSNVIQLPQRNGFAYEHAPHVHHDKYQGLSNADKHVAAQMAVANGDIELAKKIYNSITLNSPEDFDKQFFVIRDYFGKCRICYFSIDINPRTKIKRKVLKPFERNDFFQRFYG